MSWNRTGSVSVTNGSPVVIGAGTAWVANARVSEAFKGPDGQLYEIQAINGDGQMTLASPYLGATAGGQSYVIVPTQGYIRDLAAQAAALINQFGDVVNGVGSGRFGQGSTGAPSIRGAGDNDTGLNLVGGDVLDLVTGGQVRARFVSGVLTFPNAVMPTLMTLDTNEAGGAQQLPPNQDLKAVRKTGFYVTGGSDSASPDGGSWFLDHITNGGNYISQKFTATGAGNSYAPGTVFRRNCIAGQWGELILMPDFEEGPWTPTLTGNGGGLKTPTSTNYGWFTRIGRRVFLNGTVSWNGGTALVGEQVIIGGFPYASTVKNVNIRCSGTIGAFTPGSLTLASGRTSVGLTMDTGRNNAYVAQTGPDGYDLHPTVAASGDIYGISLSYPID